MSLLSQPGARRSRLGASKPAGSKATTVPTSNAELPADNDLHHKMSKKIAQLTKVIYHLNTKNEDHQNEVQGLQSSYENEIDQILKDAYKKMNTFRQKVESEYDKNKYEQMIKDMQQKFDSEKALAKKAIADIKKRSSARELTLKKQSGERIKSLAVDIANVRKRFERRVQELKKLIKTIETDHEGKLQSEKDAHQIEIADLVKKSNDHYNVMLSERLRQEDAIRVELTKSQTMAITELKKDHKHEMESQRAKADALQNEASMQSSRLISERDQQISLLNQELEQLKAFRQVGCEETEKQKKIIQDLKEQVLELTRNKNEDHQEMCHQIEEWKKRKLEVSSELKQARSMTDELRVQLSERNQQLKNLEKQITEAEGSVRSAQRDKEREETQHGAQLHSLQKTITNLNTKLVAFEADRRSLEEELDDERRRNDEAKSDVIDLKKRLEVERLNANETARSRSLNDKQWLKRLEDANLEMQKLRNSFQTELEHNRLSWKSESDRINEEHAETLRLTREENERQTIQQLDELKKELENQHEKLCEQYEQSLTEKEKSLQQLHQAANDVENVQNERLEELQETHSKELDKERSRWIQHKRSFMVEAESLRADIVILKRQARSFKDLEDELQRKVKLAEKSSEDVRAQLEKQVKDASGAACAELNARHNEEMRKLHEQYRQDITALQARLLNQGEERDVAAKSFETQLRAAREEIAKVSDEQKNIEELLAAEKKQRSVDQKEHELRVAGIRQQHQENIILAKSQLQTEHEQGIGALQRQHQKDMDDRDSAFSEEREHIRLQFKKQVDELLNAQEQTVEAMQRTAILHRNEVLDKARSEAEDKLAQERVSHRLEVTRLDDYHQKQQEIVQREREKSERDAELRADDHRRRVSELQALLESKRAENDRMKTLVVKLEEQIEKANENIETVQRESVSQAKRQQDSFDRRASVMQSEFEAVKQRIEQAHSLTRKRLDEMEHRFRNRESRKEDSERIRELEIMVSKQQTVVDHTLNEIKFYKLELLNREENYNQRFGGSPKVGVISVLSKPSKRRNSLTTKKNGQAASTSAYRKKFPPLGGCSSGS